MVAEIDAKREHSAVEEEPHKGASRLIMRALWLRACKEHVTGRIH